MMIRKCQARAWNFYRRSTRSIDFEGAILPARVLSWDGSQVGLSPIVGRLRREFTRRSRPLPSTRGMAEESCLREAGDRWAR